MKIIVEQRHAEMAIEDARKWKTIVRSCAVYHAAKEVVPDLISVAFYHIFRGDLDNPSVFGCHQEQQNRIYQLTGVSSRNMRDKGLVAFEGVQFPVELDFPDL